MKYRIAIFSFLGILTLYSCQPKNSNQGASDTTTVYGNPTDTGRREGDTVIDRGMGDSAGVQGGGSKVNVGQDTVGKMPHDK